MSVYSIMLVLVLLLTRSVLRLVLAMSVYPLVLVLPVLLTVSVPRYVNISVSVNPVSVKGNVSVSVNCVSVKISVKIWQCY